MNPREVRRQNLIYAVKIAGGTKELAARVECNPKYLEQIVRSFQGPKDKQPRTLGDDLAERIARIILGKPAEWMYQEHPELWGDDYKPSKEDAANPMWPFSIAYADYDALPAESKAELNRTVVSFIKGALSVKSGKAA
ncbi:hypothetical protein G3T20_05415 [Bordetella hinzii]|uniref:hypothetical protein n=1 Tax=Bordetella hinzii TaxID=103855 RepID=UPI0013EFDB0A|nr:hypothetical protein [Bordetella hinzii]QII84189.1 hypothetical protein G3T20_05415 [Bordetella hinzii]